MPQRSTIIGESQLSFRGVWVDVERPAIFRFRGRPIPIKKQPHIAKPDVRARQIGIELNGSQRRFLRSRHHLGRRTVTEKKATWVTVSFDSKTTQAQRDALAPIILKTYGLEWGELKVQEAPIEIRQ